MADCIVGPGNSGGGAIPPCVVPPILPGRPEGYVQVCYDDGSTAILVIDRGEANNKPCPPVAPGDPSIIGWIDSLNVYHAGAPAPGWSQCSGNTSDVELAGRMCMVDTATGTFVGSLFLLQTWDVSTTPPTYQGFEYEAVLADGTVVRNYTVPVGVQIEPCPTLNEEPVEMRECLPTGCVEFIRWYNSVTKQPVADRLLDGSAYTVVDPANVGLGSCAGCPSPSYVPFDWVCEKITGIPVANVVDATALDRVAPATHLHWVYNSVSGLGYPGAVPIPGPNPSPVLLTNVSAVQALLNQAFGAGVVYYFYDTALGTGVVYAVDPATAGTYQDFMWYGDAGSYNDKMGLVGGYRGVVSSSGSRELQVIKRFDALNNLFVDTYFAVSDAGVLTDVTAGVLAVNLTAGPCKCAAYGKPRQSRTDILTGPVVWTFAASAPGNVLTNFDWFIEKIGSTGTVTVSKSGDVTSYECCGVGESEGAECGLVDSYVVDVPNGAIVTVRTIQAVV
jgi:hypothetical protein